ncbi:hypothetical protein BT96DRAFT_922171 [Gymnopus androsaceus JB14]|uniref:Pheromone n=1 Tax=Gymnopus androsaceus JB14 TaxID=1447944 RepID=A0A6A4HH16_9AGAR|nr:hypothetical protein BT96DRAFT_922171 [Gymnopus androsaceus JB14]
MDSFISIESLLPTSAGVTSEDFFSSSSFMNDNEPYSALPVNSEEVGNGAELGYCVIS